MKIVELLAFECSIPLPEPCVIASTIIYREEGFAVRLTLENGIVGWGYGAPWEPVTYDTVTQVKNELSGIDWSAVPSIDSPANFYDAFVSELSCVTLRTAIDCAVYDAYAKSKGISLFSLLGAQRRSIPNSITLFIQPDTEETVETTREIFATYPDLTVLKIKLKGEGDIERCQAIKEIAPTRLSYILDGNEGFSDPEEAVKVINRLASILGNVLMVEEPTKKGDIAALQFVTSHVRGTRIVADESCGNSQDLQQLIDHGAVHGANIKLQKSGGITESLRMGALLEKHNLVSMVGCMLEQPTAIACGLAVALTNSSTMVTDLDGDLRAPDISAAILPFVNGSREPLLTHWGHGCDIELEKVDQRCKEGSIEYTEWIHWK